jgi:signal transduction histidine kinase
MQGLIKSGMQVRKFVPHSPVPVAVVAGAEAVSATRVPEKGRRFAPTLKPEGFDQLAHDARNVLAALKLYCELLAEPGVLTAANAHYAQELEAISDTASKLVESLSAPRRSRLWQDGMPVSRGASFQEAELPDGEAALIRATDLSDPWPSDCVDDLGHELFEMRPLLAAIAGPRIQLEIEAMPCGGRCLLSTEDLTRVMLNLVHNASEAMPDGGRLRITSQHGEGLSFLDPDLIPEGRPQTVVIAVEDSGPGIPKEILDQILSPGFTTRQAASSWRGHAHRGLGLSIVRGLIEAAGGTVRIGSAALGGARFELELPITSGMYEMANGARLMADSAGEACIECR